MATRSTCDVEGRAHGRPVGTAQGERVTDASETYESHVVAVMPSVLESGASWSELERLGLAADDLGLVLGMASVRADGEPALAAALADALGAAGPGSMLPRLARLSELPAAGDGARLFASRGYPAELLAAAAGRDGPRRTAFDGLAPPGEARALADAIAGGAVAIWARARTSEAAGQAVELLLARSADRVRTFSRGAG